MLLAIEVLQKEDGPEKRKRDVSRKDRREELEFERTDLRLTFSSKRRRWKGSVRTQSLLILLSDKVVERTVSTESIIERNYLAKTNSRSGSRSDEERSDAARGGMLVGFARAADSEEGYIK